VSRDWHRPYRTVPSHSGGDGRLPGELVRRHRGASPGRMMAPSCGVRALKARVRGLAHACGAPVSVAGPSRGRDEPSSETRPARGGVIPRAGRDRLEGSVAPRTGRSLPEGARALERRGPSWWAVGVPRRGPCPSWLVTCMVRLNVFRYWDLSEDFPVV
jgi:hypothetical protein